MSRPVGTRQKAGDKEPLHVIQIDENGDPVSVSAAGDGAILDGASAAIRATVLDLTNANPVTVAITDSNGDQISSFGGGTQYTEDAAAAANPVGTALMLVREDARAGSLTTTDGDNVAARGTNAGELYVKHVDAIPVTDNGGALTVDGTVAVTGVSTEAKQDTIIGHLDGVEGILTTIDADTGALVAQSLDYDTGGGTAAQVIIGIALPGVGGPVAGGTSTNPIQVGDGGSSLTVDNAHLTALGGAISGTEVQVDVVSSALPSGAATEAKQDTIIGHVDGIEGLLTTIDGDTGNISTKIDTLAGAVSGTEMQVDVVGALPAGTNAIGKLAANSGVDIGDVDVTSLPSLVAGTAYIGKVLPTDRDVTLHTAYAKKYYTNAGAVTDGIVWSPAAGTRWHVVSLFINVSAAATVTFEDDKAGGDEAVLKMELAANSGTVISFGNEYPLASGEDAADLIVTTTAGNVYVTVTGYEI